MVPTNISVYLTLPFNFWFLFSIWDQSTRSVWPLNFLFPRTPTHTLNWNNSEQQHFAGSLLNNRQTIVLLLSSNMSGLVIFWRPCVLLFMYQWFDTTHMAVLVWFAVYIFLESSLFLLHTISILIPNLLSEFGSWPIFLGFLGLVLKFGVVSSFSSFLKGCVFFLKVVKGTAVVYKQINEIFDVLLASYLCASFNSDLHYKLKCSILCSMTVSSISLASWANVFLKISEGCQWIDCGSNSNWFFPLLGLFGCSVVDSSSKWEYFVGWVEFEDLFGWKQGSCYSMYAASPFAFGHMACFFDTPRKARPSASTQLSWLHNHKSIGCGDHCFHVWWDWQEHKWRAKFLDPTFSGMCSL